MRKIFFTFGAVVLFLFGCSKGLEPPSKGAAGSPSLPSWGPASETGDSLSPPSWGPASETGDSLSPPSREPVSQAPVQCSDPDFDRTLYALEEAESVFGGAWIYLEHEKEDACTNVSLIQENGGWINIQKDSVRHFDDLYRYKREQEKVIDVAGIGDQAYFAYRLEPGFGEEPYAGNTRLHIKKREKAVIITCQKPNDGTGRGVVCSRAESEGIGRLVIERLE